MKKFSLKLKLTLWYSFVMIFMSIAMIALLFSFSNRELLSNKRAELKENVEDNIENIEFDDGALDVDSDFYALEDDIYLSLYDKDENFLYGKIPQGFHSVSVFDDQEIHTIKLPEQTWYVYDYIYQLEDYGPLQIRGITSVTKAEQQIRTLIRMSLIFFPLLIFFTVLIGYRMTRKALLPVQQLTETVQQIQKDGNLSHRLNLSDSANHHQDEIHHLAATFDDMLEQLERTFQREKQFTSDVSHELRTPVSVILAQCSACLDDPCYTDTQREQLSLIEHKTRQISAIISQLLILSRADAGKEQLSKEWINISELTEMAAEEQQLLADNKQITIETDITPDLTAFVDETFYIRLLMNLLSNAIQYGKEGGWIHISLQKATEGIVCKIRDNGCGISSEALPHIWERFYRTDSARTNLREESHAGLGLSMAKWIVEAHNGTISVESEPDKGTTFTFLLPK